MNEMVSAIMKSTVDKYDSQSNDDDSGLEKRTKSTDKASRIPRTPRITPHSNGRRLMVILAINTESVRERADGFFPSPVFRAMGSGLSWTAVRARLKAAPGELLRLPCQQEWCNSRKDICKSFSSVHWQTSLLTHASTHDTCVKWCTRTHSYTQNMVS